MGIGQWILHPKDKVVVVDRYQAYMSHFVHIPSIPQEKVKVTVDGRYKASAWSSKDHYKASVGPD